MGLEPLVDFRGFREFLSSGELCTETGISSTQLLEALQKRFERETLLKIVNLDDVADAYGLSEARERQHRLQGRRTS